MTPSADADRGSALPTAVAGRNDPYAHAHSVQFYADDAFLLDELSRFVGAALGAGDAAVVIATAAHRQALDARLRTLGLEVAFAIEQGRYVAWDAAEILARCMPRGRLDAECFAGLASGAITRAAAATGGVPSRVALFGELVTLLCEMGQPEEAIRLEGLWSDLARTHGFSLRCAYPMRLFNRAADSETVARICAAHAHVIPAESYSTLLAEDARLRAITHLQQKAQALETEIDERKKAQRSLQRREAELADFLENALEGIQQVGADGVIVWANKALLNLLGYAPEEYAGRPLSEFHVHRQVFEEFWRKLMRREDIYDFPTELRCKDGSSKYVRMHSNGLWEDGQFVSTRCFIRDVTEQKRMEQALCERNYELRAAVAARNEFLSVAAHELKTPITSLRAFAQLLLRDVRRKGEVAPERLASALGTIEVQTGKLSQLMGRLLDTAQLQAGKLRIEPAPTDIVALIQSALARHYRDASHTFIFDGPERFEAVVDPVRFEQVITNLVDNAVKFSPAGGAVKVALGQDGGGAMRLSVTDQGVGIPPDQREQIFDRFHPAHGDRHLSGLGIGLYITREIVELHGGCVRVEAPAAGGSRIVVILPALAVGALHGWES